VLYWLFAVILLGGTWLFKKNFIRVMMEKQVSLPDSVWSNLNLSWAGFFVVMGVANLYVAYNFSTDDWVNFKLFGTTGMMLVFVVVQSFMLSKHIQDKE
jgi:intracellular septation protein